MQRVRLPGLDQTSPLSHSTFKDFFLKCGSAFQFKVARRCLNMGSWFFFSFGKSRGPRGYI